MTTQLETSNGKDFSKCAFDMTINPDTRELLPSRGGCSPYGGIKPLESINRVVVAPRDIKCHAVFSI
jgi:hypothetical protein